MLSTVESSAGPITSKRARSDLTLNEVFGTPGQVSLLRILTTESDGSIAAPKVAARIGMTPSGARKALRRLARAGVVKKIGRGKATRYVLCGEGRLAQEIARLFQLERQAAEPDWTPNPGDPPSPAHHRDPGVPHANGGEKARSAGTNGNGTARSGPINGKNGPGSPLKEAGTEDRPVPELDPASAEFRLALVSLLEEDLSLIRRARQKVSEKLEHRHPGNGHDDWEWRKILDTYPLPRLLSFLESDSPRAARLRKSSPFPEVMSDREKERLSRLAERVH